MLILRWSETNRSSGKSSPSRGRCVKEYEEQLQGLQHENFNLKLRVFLLEERVGKALGRGDAADIIKHNIELKVENETLKKSLSEKNQLLNQASAAIEELENQQKSWKRCTPSRSSNCTINSINCRRFFAPQLSELYMVKAAKTPLTPLTK